MADLHPGIAPLAQFLNAWGIAHQDEVLKASGYNRTKALEEALALYIDHAIDLRMAVESWAENELGEKWDEVEERIAALLEVE